MGSHNMAEAGRPLSLETPPCNFHMALQMRRLVIFQLAAVACSSSGINVWGHQWCANHSGCHGHQYLQPSAINSKPTAINPDQQRHQDVFNQIWSLLRVFCLFCSQQIAACPCADQRLSVSFCIWSPTGIPLQPDGSLLLFPAPFPHAAAMPLDLGCAHLADYPAMSFSLYVDK